VWWDRGQRMAAAQLVALCRPSEALGFPSPQQCLTRRSRSEAHRVEAANHTRPPPSNRPDSLGPPRALSPHARQTPRVEDFDHAGSLGCCAPSGVRLASIRPGPCRLTTNTTMICKLISQESSTFIRRMKSSSLALQPASEHVNFLKQPEADTVRDVDLNVHLIPGL